MREPFALTTEEMDRLTEDLLLYGNAFVHIANIDGELKGRRVNPKDVSLPGKKK